MAALNLQIDAESTTAPYEQIRMQVIEAVRSGRLVAGDKLPTVLWTELDGLKARLGLD